MEGNAPAQRFWAAADSKFRAEAVGPVRVEKDGRWWQVFTFES